MGKDAIDLYRRQPDVFVIGYSRDKAYYDALLKIGQEIEYVPQVYNDAYEPLSVRFRSVRTGRRSGQNYDINTIPDGD
jgi:hypothetical protein